MNDTRNDSPWISLCIDITLDLVPGQLGLIRIVKALSDEGVNLALGRGAISKGCAAYPLTTFSAISPKWAISSDCVALLLRSTAASSSLTLRSAPPCQGGRPRPCCGHRLWVLWAGRQGQEGLVQLGPPVASIPCHQPQRTSDTSNTSLEKAAKLRPVGSDLLDSTQQLLFGLLLLYVLHAAYFSRFLLIHTL